MEKRETFAQALCEVLVKQRVVSEAEGRALARAFKSSEKENFDDFLLEEGLVDENVLLRALGQHYQLPAVDVTGYFFDTQLLRNFPKDFLLRNRIIPLEVEDDFMTVVASDPDNQDLLSAIGAYTSEDIQFRVGLGRDISDAVKEFYDKSPTDLIDDNDTDLIDEQLGQEVRYHSLLNDEDYDIGATVKENLDSDEE
jgi:Type II secretion system (T2SS), protein E, N-terminal domain